MTTVTTRAGKGTALTHTEVDENFTNLRDNIGGTTFPKTAGIGVKIDEDAPGFGWHDLLGPLQIDIDNANRAVKNTFIGGMRVFQFVANTSEAFVLFHLPHDYVPNTDIFLHFHWAHNSATLTGGSVTWGAEFTYAKGHDQQPFSATKLFTVAQVANIVQYQHMIAEASLSVVSGSATQINTEDVEVDGIISCRVYLDSNDLIDSVSVPDPFLFFVDVHYQSSGLATKQKAPNFYT